MPRVLIATLIPLLMAGPAWASPADEEDRPGRFVAEHEVATESARSPGIGAGAAGHIRYWAASWLGLGGEIAFHRWAATSDDGATVEKPSSDSLRLGLDLTTRLRLSHPGSKRVALALLALAGIGRSSDVDGQPARSFMLGAGIQVPIGSQIALGFQGRRYFDTDTIMFRLSVALFSTWEEDLFAIP